MFITKMYPEQINEKPPHFTLFIRLNFSINVFHRSPMRFYRTKEETTMCTILLLFLGTSTFMNHGAMRARSAREAGEVCSRKFPQGHPVESGRFVTLRKLSEQSHGVRP